MKKFIILLLTVLLCGCSTEKPAEILSSMQTEPATSETTAAETPETTAPTESKYPEQETVSEAATTAPVKDPVPADTQETPNPPAEASKTETPTEIPETAETPSEGVTESPEAEFDVNYWVDFAMAYVLQIGLEIDPTAVDCWDNPTTAKEVT